MRKFLFVNCCLPLLYLFLPQRREATPSNPHLVQIGAAIFMIVKRQFLTYKAWKLSNETNKHLFSLATRDAGLGAASDQVIRLQYDFKLSRVIWLSRISSKFFRETVFLVHSKTGSKTLKKDHEHKNKH